MQDDAPILRPAARVLLIDHQDRVLLFRVNVGAGDVWITPGGALEPGVRGLGNAPIIMPIGSAKTPCSLSPPGCCVAVRSLDGLEESGWIAPPDLCL